MKKKNFIEYVFILIIAFLVITIASKNSFLYRINDWWDANAFMSVGKSWIEGFIPYQDLFEQKGPVLYLIYALASLVSKNTFIGVYLLEILSLMITLIFVRKIIKLFIDDQKYCYLGLVIFGFSTIFISTFGHGGSAEEFVMPLFLISLYYFANYLKSDDYHIKKKILFINGLIAGIVLWIKYSLLGFWFIFEASYFFVNIFKKNYKEALLSTIIFLSGMFIATIPWLIYFGINHALDDLFNVYFLVNMNAYASNANIIMKLVTACGLAIYNLICNPVYLIFILLPLIFLFVKKINWGKKGANIILGIMILFTGLGTFIGGTYYFYYGYILTSFNIIGVILILSYLKKKKIKINMKVPFILTIVLLAGYTVICDNPNYILLKKSDYAQFKFAEIIKKEDNPTLLNYNCLDIGLYTTTGITPKYYYFMKNNISRKKYPEMMNEQERYIKEDKPTFVVTKKKEKSLDENYEIISEHTQKYEDKMRTYYLYKLKKD